MSNVRIDRVTQGREGSEQPADRRHIDRKEDLQVYVVADLPYRGAPEGEYFKIIDGVPNPETRQPLDPPTMVDRQYRFSLIHYTLRGDSEYSFHFADDLSKPNYEDRWEIITEIDPESVE